MRTEGALDLLAFALELRLSGELAEGAARARIRVHCKGRSELRMTVTSSAPRQGRDGPQVGAANLALSVHARDGAARRRRAFDLTAASGPMPITGALVGECGLRGKSEGGGLQWFFALRAEP
jgi:hypothetical protein